MSKIFKIGVVAAILISIEALLVIELEKDDSPPDSSIEAARDRALRVIAQKRHDRERRAEQQGAGQPVTKPADKVPAKVQPLTPTSKDGPR